MRVAADVNLMRLMISARDLLPAAATTCCASTLFHSQPPLQLPETADAFHAVERDDESGDGCLRIFRRCRTKVVRSFNFPHSVRVASSRRLLDAAFSIPVWREAGVVHGAGVLKEHACE